MKKFFFRVLIVVAILAAVDVLTGVVFRRVVRNVPDTDEGHANAKTALMDKTADILILGASKASRHYVPALFEEKTGLDTYNGGRDGNDILYSFAVLQEMDRRHHVSSVILDINMMQLDGTWQNQFIPEYKCYYGYVESITKTIDRLAGWNERVKLLSNLYRYNGTIPWLGLSYVKGEKTGNDGYMPLWGSDGFDKVQAGTTSENIPELYASTFAEMAAFCRDKGIVFTVCYSPALEIAPAKVHEAISALCSANGVKYLNYNDDIRFTDNRELFKDVNHMNDTGARLFTNLLLQ